MLGFVDTYLRLNAQETLLFRREEDSLEPKEKESVMQLTTSWKEEGIQEGIQKGLQEGQRDLVWRMLRRRWGQLPSGMEGRIDALPVQELGNLAEALWDFTSLADVEKWLEQHK